MPLYLLLDLAAISIPLLFSFEKRLEFYKQWKTLFSSIVIVGAAFIFWDSQFTKMGIWGFSKEYLTGIMLGNLPLEEYLFFICVPYAGVFTFHVFRTLMPGFSLHQKKMKFVLLCISAILITAGIYYNEKCYTCSTFIFAGISIAIAAIFFTKHLSHFLISYLAIMLPFFLMNGILTGLFIKGEVVWYNDEENLGIRMLTIPFEDLFYGLGLLLWNTQLTVWLGNKKSHP